MRRRAASDGDWGRLLAAERPLQETRPDRAAVRGALLYPNRYEIGMSNLAVHALLRALNRDGISCERVFLPPDEVIGDLRASRRRLATFQTATPLDQLDFVAITCPFELDYLNVPLMLSLGGVAPLSAERGAGAPLVLLGGPAPTANPLPLAAFADAMLIGEVEPVEERLREALRRLDDSRAGEARGQAGKPGARARQEALDLLRETPGFLVASGVRAGAPWPVAERQWASDLDSLSTCSVILTPHTELGLRFLIEVGRGCGRGCRFCLARQVYHPSRVRRPEGIIEACEAARGRTDQVGLVGAALSDYPWIDELCQGLRARGWRISVSSVRAESVSPALLRALAHSGQRSVTYAPEAGTESLRASIGKAMTDQQLCEAVARAAEAGLDEVKLYFMLGIPGEELADVEAIAGLVATLRGRFPKTRFQVSASPFVPKPHTELEMATMLPVSELRRRAGIVRSALARLGISARPDSARWALVQAAFSRGGAELAPAILAASLADRSLHALQQAMASAGLRLEDYRKPRPDARGRPPWAIGDVACARRRSGTRGRR